MKEQAQANRGLEDISHYFLTEKKEGGEETSEPVNHYDELSKEVEKKNLFLLGAGSKEGRAVLASNLACEWSLNHKVIELVEDGEQLQNAHFFVGGVPSESENGCRVSWTGAGSIALTKWESQLSSLSTKGEWTIWNVCLDSTLKLINESSQAPICVILLEEKRENLLQAYSEMKQVLSLRPGASFYVVRYSNQSSEKSQTVFEFFQKTARKFLNVEVQDSGQIVKDVYLAKSILRRYPVVLFSEENILSKSTLKKLAKELVEV